MAEEEKHEERCPYCGAKRSKLPNIVRYCCCTFKNKEGVWLRGRVCYDRELSQVTAERDTYEPYYKALKSRHNGYDTRGIRRTTMTTEAEKRTR